MEKITYIDNLEKKTIKFNIVGSNRQTVFDAIDGMKKTQCEITCFEEFIKTIDDKRTVLSLQVVRFI